MTEWGDGADGDGADIDAPAERFDLLGDIYDAVHRSMREISDAEQLSNRK